MKLSINKILIFSRPWEVSFHIGLARSLENIFPEVRICFASMFFKVVEECHRNDYECHYLPDLLSEADDRQDEDMIRMIDSEVSKSFGTNLNALLNGERFLPENPYEINKFLMRHIRTLSNIIEPGTLSLSSMYDHFLYCLAGALTNNRSGIHVAFVGCGVPGGRVLPLRSPSSVWNMGEMAGKSIDQDVLANEIRSKKSSERIEYMRMLDRNVSKNSSGISMLCRIQGFFRRRRYDIYDYAHGSYFVSSKTPVIKSFVGRILRKMKKRRITEYDINDVDVIENTPGIYVALHMEPEATLLMYSPWLNDQLQFIQQLAISLPSGACLYVKENPKMIGVRTESYYQRLRKIPNVYLVNHLIESNELIKRTYLTASIAGTVTTEAFLLGKPSLCAGRPPFEFLATFRMYEHSYTELKQFIASVFSGDVILNSGSPENRSLFERWLNMSFSAQCVPLYDREGEMHVPSNEENVKSYVDAIVCIMENYDNH